MTNIPQSKTQVFLDDLHSALLYWVSKSTAPHAALFDIPTIMQDVRHRLLSQSSGVHVFGNYAVLWDTYIPWYGKEAVLVEDLVIRLDSGVGSVDEAINGLKELAEDMGFRWLFAGDTQSLGYMTRKYVEAGFDNIGAVLVRRM